MDKKALRKVVREKKRAMTEHQIISASTDLCGQFINTQQYADARTVYGYLPYNQEVRTVPILQRAMDDGKRVAVPKVYGDEMRFIYINDFDCLEDSNMGIPEPVSDGPIAEDKTALVIMPGVAFDADGNRVGYGGGFYDRFLSAEPNHPTIALCYDFQMVPKLETETFDIPVDLVLWAKT
jgi:5-formyltetrahydrofolate cyclo-ligase